MECLIAVKFWHIHLVQFIQGSNVSRAGHDKYLCDCVCVCVRLWKNFSKNLRLFLCVTFFVFLLGRMRLWSWEQFGETAMVLLGFLTMAVSVGNLSSRGQQVHNRN